MGHGQVDYALANSEGLPQPSGHPQSEDQFGAMFAAVSQAAKANGFDVNSLIDKHCGRSHGGCGGTCGTNAGNTTPVLASTGGFGSPLTTIPWGPELGACPENLAKLLCFIYKASCSYNKFAKLGTVKLRTDAASLPDPNANIGFSIGPGQDEQLLGIQFPVEWTGEAMFHGIFRVKVSFNVSNISDGGLTFAQIRDGLFENLDFRVIQSGTEDDYDVAISFGDAHDAQNSDLAPSLGGFYLPCGMEFIPFIWRVELQSFDFRGIAPGGAGDTYDVAATISAYFKDVCVLPKKG